MLSSDQARILWCLICAAGYYRPIDWQDCSLFLTHSPPRRGTVSLIRKAAVTLYRSDHIHIRPSQSKSVHSTGLQPGNNILVYQTTIHHRYHFQRFRIGNTTTIYHFAFNT